MFDENHRRHDVDHDVVTAGVPRSEKGGGLRYFGCVTNQNAETSAPIIYGVALSTPAHVVQSLAAALVGYRKRIGTRWRAYDATLQAILTIAWLEGGHTYRGLGEGNGVPKSTCRTMVQEGIKVLARRALPLTEIVHLARKAGWDYLIVDGVNSRVAPVHCCTGAPSGPCMPLVAAHGPSKPRGRFRSLVVARCFPSPPGRVCRCGCRLRVRGVSVPRAATCWVWCGGPGSPP